MSRVSRIPNDVSKQVSFSFIGTYIKKVLKLLKNTSKTHTSKGVKYKYYMFGVCYISKIHRPCCLVKTWPLAASSAPGRTVSVRSRVKTNKNTVGEKTSWLVVSKHFSMLFMFQSVFNRFFFFFFILRDFGGTYEEWHGKRLGLPSPSN